MNKKIEIKKIPLEAFIETLVTMYNSGVEYVNMIVEKGEKQDSIWIDGDNSIVSAQPEKKEVINNIDLEDLI
jgi:hypothetical protein